MAESPFYTKRANFHTGPGAPDGPLFSGFHLFGRLPWSGDREPEHCDSEDGPCAVCGGPPPALAIGEAPRLLFCSGEHYLACWRGAGARTREVALVRLYRISI